MNLKKQESELLEKWLNDPSFYSWAKATDLQAVNQWEQYFQSNPELRELGIAGRELIVGIPFRDIPTDESKKQAALSKLMQRLDENTPKKQSTSQIRRHLPLLPLRIAASLAFILLASGLIYFQLFYNPQILIATNYGEQLEYQLPDGSKITLNANSTLSYRTRNPRTVRIEGEAFFEVRKIAETNEKFHVWTSDLSVTVLGTSFNVNTRNDETRVFLEEGKVKLELEASAQPIEMEPGDFIAYSKGKQQLIEKKKNSSLLENAAWKQGSLIFKDTPLPEALSDIEDIYGVKFVLQSDKLKQKVISGGVPIKNLEVTLLTLSEIYGLEVRKNENKYFLYELEPEK